MSDDRTIRAGDHLWVQRLGYEHHGLATGQHGYSVFREGWDLRDRGNRGGAAFGLREGPQGPFHRSPESPAQPYGQRSTGRERVGENEYNLVFNNCEHFVMWCIEDKHTSEQVNRKVRTAGHVATAAMMYRWYETWTTEEATADSPGGSPDGECGSHGVDRR